jgi:hypothetical protein
MLVAGLKLQFQVNDHPVLTFTVNNFEDIEVDQALNPFWQLLQLAI